MEKEKRAEVTAFLSLVIILLVTFTASLLEAASIQVAKNERRADMDRALESVFAEYQVELLEQYDVFGLDATYESGSYSEDAIIRRLAYFGAGSMGQEIKRIQLLTDDAGQAFFEQVLIYMKQKYGLDAMSGQASMTDTWKHQEELGDSYQEEETAENSRLDSLLAQGEASLPEQDNPIDYVNDLKQQSVLSLVMPENKTVSSKTLDLGGVVSRRDLNEGYGDFSDVSVDDGTLSSLWFGEYLLGHFSSAVDEGQEGALDYELEYIYAGKSSDKANLEAVVKKLLLMRFAVNYMYVKSSAAKKGEAEALALTLCSLLAVPQIEQAVTQVILLAWAYGESIVDLRALLKGNKVPLTKDDASWQLSLSGLMTLNESGRINDGMDSKNGLGYEEYMRILLFLGKKKKLRLRTMDLVEKNLQMVYGQDFFQMDACVSKIEWSSTCSFRRGIQYQFQTYFGYQ